jgi:cytochrome c oxidase assembly protein subunit 15
VLLAVSTLALIFVGALVTSTGSGLAVPDWPLSYGMLMPPMVGGVFYEHGHRLAASVVGLLTLVGALWTARAEKRPGVRRLAWACLALVVAQGVLGGLTVLLLLPTPVSVAHACIAQTFLCLVVALAYATSREWLEALPPIQDRFAVRPAAVLATAAVYVQLVLGAVMRHLGAGLAIPDFPLALGRLVPPLDSPPVALHFAHRAFALVVLAAVGAVLARTRRSTDARLRRAASIPLALVLVQIGLGAATILTGRSVPATTLHVATGAAVLASCWLLTLRAFRRLRAADGAALAAASVPGVVGAP